MKRGDMIHVKRGFGDPRPSFVCVVVDVHESAVFSRGGAGERVFYITCLFRDEIHDLFLYEELGDTYEVIGAATV